MTKYGFIGLGSQGAPMARRMLDAGLPVVLWARRAQTLEPFGDTAAEVAASVAALAEQVDQVSICVVDDGGVRELCDQLLPAMRAGSRIVIHSTVSPALCQALAREAGERGLQLLDAPVSGGGNAAAEGTLTVMAGGSAEVLEAARPALETFAGRIVHLGGAGAGQNAKLINNAMMAANLATAYHALQLAAVLGIEKEAFVDLVKISSGRSFSFEVCARIPEPAAFSHGAKLLDKDVRLLGETVGQNDACAAIRETARTFLERAIDNPR